LGYTRTPYEAQHNAPDGGVGSFAPFLAFSVWRVVVLVMVFLVVGVGLAGKTKNARSMCGRLVSAFTVVFSATRKKPAH
jgi:hypothetical protein